MTDPKIVVRGEADFRRLYGDLSKAETGFGKLGRTVKAGLIGATVAGGAALVKLASDSVGAASLSQQSIGATETVFKRYADTVIRRSEDAADSVGLSANEYRELANVTGAMLKNAGTPLAKVTDLTHQLEKRAADLAATYGGTTREAIEAVNSLLRGEADPIERYGVSIKQADVNARLAAKGLDDLEGSARKQAEQQERLRLLFKQTADSAGQFARESDTLAGAQQRLGAKVDDVQARFGTLLLPVMTEVAEWAGDELVPALEDLAGWLEENKGEIADTGAAIKDALLPPLKAGVDLVQTAVDVWGELPGPVKELGIQAGLAALVLPRLTATTSAAGGAMSSFAAKVRDAETRSAALGRAAKYAAGVGGMVALTQGMSDTESATGTLLTVLGGAALGFSVGGPWGAAVGAIGGVTTGLAAADDAAVLTINKFELLRDTLDETTGAMTGFSRTAVAEALRAKGDSLNQDFIGIARDAGISLRTLTDAALGNDKAMRRVMENFKQSGDLQMTASGWYAQEQGVQDLLDVLGLLNIDLRSSRREVRENARASQELAGKLKGIPKDVRIKVKENGIPVTVRGLASLAKRADLVPKQIRTLIEAADLPYTVKQIRGYQTELDKTDRKRPNPKLTADDRRLKDAIGVGNRALDELGRRRAEPSSRLDLAPFMADRGRLIASLSSIPDEHVTIWLDRKYSGGDGSGGGGGDRTNPRELFGGDETSEKAQAFGAELRKALATGLRSTEPEAKKAGGNLLQSILAGVVGGSDQVRSALDKITKLIEKRINLKDGKAERAREKAVLKHLSDEYAALLRIGKAHDAINRKLEKAREHLAEVRQFVDGIRQSFIDTGNVVQLGQLDDGTVSGGLMIDQLRDQVAQAEQFAQLIRDLTDDEGPKINQTTLQQLLAAGPQAGLATAQALLSGGSAAIDEINTLTAQLAATGQQLGSQMSNQFFDVGLQAAQGIVDGLEAQEAALERAARRLARKLAQAIKNALGGGKGGGKDSKRSTAEALRGLSLGIDETAARQHGARLAAAFRQGFGTPQLGGDLGGGGRGAKEQTLRIEIRGDAIDDLRAGKTIVRQVAFGRARGTRSLALGSL